MANPSTAAPAPATITDATATTKKASNRSYPYSESIKIRLIRKNTTTILPESGTAYNTASDYVMRIGGAFAGKNNPLPLGRVIWNDAAEEERVMGIILATGRQHPDWNKLLDGYWQNYSFPVPYVGITLEIGMKYENENDPGTPLAPNDYVLYRYCLKYNGVANTPEVANRSPKIRFILISEDAERNRATATLELQDKATVKRLELLRDPKMVDAVLVLMDGPFNANDVERKIALADLSKNKPAEFLALANDPNLLNKAFVGYALYYGVVRRPANSDTIIYNERSLGTLTDASVYFASNEGANDRADIEARIADIKKG